jgi:hypothetical protein
MSCDDELTFPRFCQVAVGLLVQRLSAVTFVWVTRRISVTKIWVVRARIEKGGKACVKLGSQKIAVPGLLAYCRPQDLR